MEPITFKTPEFEKKERSQTWYIAAFLIAFAFVSVSWYTGNHLFIVFLLLASAALVLLNMRTPRILDARIDDEGITIDTYTIPYENIISFSIVDRNEETDYLFIQTTGPLSRIPHRLIAPKDERIHTRLRTSLEETEHTESLIETLARLLKL
jgi:hypothetical protein